MTDISVPVSPAPVKPVTPSSNPAVSKSDSLKKLLTNRWVVAIGMALIILAIGLSIYILLTPKKVIPTPNQIVDKIAGSTISGIIDLDGVAPVGSTLGIGVKKYGEKEYQTVITGIAISGDKAWSWNGAKAGDLYEVQAGLLNKGQIIATSEVKTIAAPADEEILYIDAKSASDKSLVVISGTFDLNGYIPPKSTISIKERKVGEQNFDTVVSSLPAVDGGSWTWNSAQNGVSYEIKAVLIANGNNGGESTAKVMVAPDANETLRINSTLQPPSGGTVVVGGISGVFDINGTPPSGSSVVIVARPRGTSKYNVVASGLPASDNTAWNYSGAVAGTIYNLQAVLKVNGNDYVISNTITTAAPATNEVFVLNIPSQLPAPPQGPFVSCAGQSGGLWSVNVTFNYVNNATQYWIKVGDPSSDNRYFDSKVTAQNQSGQTQQSVSTSYVLGSGGTYYAKYAYSYSSIGNNNFSPWSGTTSFVCPPTPTSTPVPTLTNTPVPTATSTPVPTDTPTPTTAPAPTNSL
ncbi:MAG: hypothetical protein Q7R97_01015 [Candidatus Daviesbacteria bacterium]|nr:hypothetical protein [Candidatus Daviesbacteria bacterium]